jgi:hypothetical protein
MGLQKINTKLLTLPYRDRSDFLQEWFSLLSVTEQTGYLYVFLYKCLRSAIKPPQVTNNVNCVQYHSPFCCDRLLLVKLYPCPTTVASTYQLHTEHWIPLLKRYVPGASDKTIFTLSLVQVHSRYIWTTNERTNEIHLQTLRILLATWRQRFFYAKCASPLPTQYFCFVWLTINGDYFPTQR